MNPGNEKVFFRGSWDPSQSYARLDAVLVCGNPAQGIRHRIFIALQEVKHQEDPRNSADWSEVMVP